MTRTEESSAPRPPSLGSATSRARIWLGRQRYRWRRFRRHSASERALRAAGPVLPVRIHAPLAGLGAHLNMATVLIGACEAHGVVPRFRFTSPQYGRDDGSLDWLAGLYHQPRSPIPPAPARHEVVITCWDDVSRSFRSGRKLGRPELAVLLRRHFALAPELAERHDALAQELIVPASTLGVHFRGGDKFAEARPVGHDKMLAAIRRTLSLHPEIGHIFVATDSAPFLAQLGDACDGRPVRRAPDVQRTSDRTGVHFTKAGDRVGRARQALLDALLLGRCARLLKTESSLSQWTLLLNPALPVEQLNRRYAPPVWTPWFPLAENFTGEFAA